MPFTPDCAALGMEEDAVLAAYTVKAPGYTGELTVRMRAPEGERLYVLSDGAAVSHSFTRDGSYIVFALENGGSVIYAETERTAYLWPAIGGGAAVIAAAGAYLLFCTSQQIMDTKAKIIKHKKIDHRAPVVGA